MHVIHPDPRLLLAALVALALALVAFAAAPALDGLELGGGSPAGPGTTEPVKGPATPPAWASDPLAPPPLLR